MMRAAPWQALIGALALAALLCWFGPTVLDNSGDWQASAAATDAQRHAQRQQRAERVAWAMCADATGSPNTVPVWQADGSVRCATKRGHLLTKVATK